MRIQIASDLHLEHIEWRFPDYRGVEPTAADILILAGDIASGTRALDLFGNWPYPVIYIPGNHESYGASIEHTEAEFLRRAATFPNIHVLTQGRCEIAGIRFLGCTLWTDYDLFGTENHSLAMAICERQIIDHLYIKTINNTPFKPADALQIHQAQKQWLRDQLADPFAGKTVVITHHAPSRLSLHPIYTNDLSSAGFVSDLSDLMGSATLHIHGHTHNSFDYVINGTRVIANPMGYNRGIKSVLDSAELQHENPYFNSRLVIDI